MLPEDGVSEEASQLREAQRCSQGCSRLPDVSAFKPLMMSGLASPARAAPGIWLRFLILSFRLCISWPFLIIFIHFWSFLWTFLKPLLTSSPQWWLLDFVLIRCYSMPRLPRRENPPPCTPTSGGGAGTVNSATWKACLDIHDIRALDTMQLPQLLSEHVPVKVASHNSWAVNLWQATKNATLTRHVSHLTHLPSTLEDLKKCKHAQTTWTWR